MRARLTEADADLARGNVAAARAGYLEVMTRAIADRQYADLLARAVGSCPPGPVPPAAARALASWRDWSLNLTLCGDNPLPRPVFRRLCGLADDADAARTAWASLLDDDLPRAELLERGAQPAWDETWGPYFITKARLLAGSDTRMARSSLDRVTGGWRHRAPYVAMLALLEAAEGSGRTPPQVGAPSAMAWCLEPGVAWMPFSIPARSDRLTLSCVVLGSKPAGGVMEIQLDGHRLATRALGGPLELTLQAELAPGLHLLAVKTVAGGRVIPGEVTPGA